MCRLKAKAGKLWNRAQILVSRKCEYSKSFSKTKVFKLQVCKVIRKYRFINHFFLPPNCYTQQKSSISVFKKQFGMV